ncbi:NADH dehydrogenase subunit 5 [Aneurinibacillus terranovensis]|uniref:NADH dehydrogenase subunit 5 n=1 Tax=Aneurinibacillus terranovensis TaxID=278991 RepID=UPI000425E2A6|nr:NADH dehydrogenase subunit 5 [Aneurinibacillus terranovensis]
MVGLSFVLFPTAFFIVLAVSLLSAIFLLYPRVPVTFVRIHIGLISLPPIVALLALVFGHRNVFFGPWRFDSLSWLIALFVLTIGLFVQRYSVHYLLGDRSYRTYFALLTFTTVADSVAWLSDDLRWLLVCWGATLLGLTWLIRLKKEWYVARNAAFLSGRLFLMSWLILLAAILWVANVTGHWQLSLVLTPTSLAKLSSWERTSINLLLVIAVMIPAAQWPFQRWLFDSVVAPTPISAIMHAGIVNAGGLLLTLFAPNFNDSAAQMVLLVWCSLSVLMGSGIMLVQVDYKRQLVGSTMAQMGFMLIQCALGAYWAAIAHAILHGVFKATLFLRAGSAIQHDKPLSRNVPYSLFWNVIGVVLGLIVGIVVWLTSRGDVYQLVSAIFLGWSVSLAWTKLVAQGYGRIGRIAGASLFAGVAVVFYMTHTAFYLVLQATIQKGFQPPILSGTLLMFLLFLGSFIGSWFVRRQSSTSFAIFYLWLVHLSEPQNDSVETHPTYLIKSISRR